MKRIIAFTLLLCLIACKKDIESLPLPDQDGNIWLRDVKSSSLIKKTIQGEWKIHYSFGGVAGNQKTVLNNSFFKFLNTDSLYLSYEGSVFAQTNTTLSRKQTVFGFDAWVLDFEVINTTGLREELYIENLHNDTLVLAHNSVDPLGFKMTRIP